MTLDYVKLPSRGSISWKFYKIRPQICVWCRLSFDIHRWHFLPLSKPWTDGMFIQGVQFHSFPHSVLNSYIYIYIFSIVVRNLPFLPWWGKSITLWNSCGLPLVSAHIYSSDLISCYSWPLSPFFFFLIKFLYVEILLLYFWVKL